MHSTNVAKVQAMYDAMVQGDFDAIKNYLHEDVIVTEAECLPYGGIHRGPEAYIQLVNTLLATWDDLDLIFKAIMGEGDMVVVVSEIKAKNKAGVAFTMPLTEVFHFTDGKVSEVRPYYFDTHKLAELSVQQV